MTRETFHQQLERLDGEVAGMAELARRMLHDSLVAMEKGDAALAEQVAASAAELAAFDERIEHAALGLLMLQAPVARDLRRIGAILKIITYLNRIGRYGFDTAKVVKQDPEGTKAVRLASLRAMARNVERMLDLVLAAFRARSGPDVPAVMALEEDVDAQRASVQRECLTYMMQDPRNIEPYANVMMVARYLERCGDNVVKMAEKLHYAATGQRILL